MRRTLAVGLAALAAVGSALAAQSPAPIEVFASVEAANGVPLEGLTAEDFEVAIDGTPVRFTLAAPAPQPLDTLLLADLTTSVTNRVRTIVAQPWPETFSLAADRLITDLRTTDRARIAAMLGARLVSSPAWTNDRLALRRGVRVFTLPDGPVEPSPLWDAVDEGLALFGDPEPGRRRHILLVTDGRATGNRASLGEVAARAVRAGVAVSVVELDPPARSLSLPHSDETPGPRALLERLTSATGGAHRVVTADARGTHQTRTPVGQILDLMRTSYRLTLAAPPGNTAAPRAIVVRVKRPGLTVRAPAEAP